MAPNYATTWSMTSVAGLSPPPFGCPRQAGAKGLADRRQASRSFAGWARGTVIGWAGLGARVVG